MALSHHMDSLVHSSVEAVVLSGAYITSKGPLVGMFVHLSDSHFLGLVSSNWILTENLTNVDVGFFHSHPVDSDKRSSLISSLQRDVMKLITLDKVGSLHLSYL